MGGWSFIFSIVELGRAFALLFWSYWLGRGLLGTICGDALSSGFPLVPFSSSSFHGCLAAEFVFHLNHGIQFQADVFKSAWLLSRVFAVASWQCRSTQSALQIRALEGVGWPGNRGLQSSEQDLCWLSWGWRCPGGVLAHWACLAVSWLKQAQCRSKGWSPLCASDLHLDPPACSGHLIVDRQNLMIGYCVRMKKMITRRSHLLQEMALSYWELFSKLLTLAK